MLELGLRNADPAINKFFDDIPVGGVESFWVARAVLNKKDEIHVTTFPFRAKKLSEKSSMLMAVHDRAQRKAKVPIVSPSSLNKVYQRYPRFFYVVCRSKTEAKGIVLKAAVEGRKKLVAERWRQEQFWDDILRDLKNFPD